MRPTQPYEAKQAPRLELADPQVQAASHAAVTAVAGFVYTGDTPDAVMSTLRFLSARPDVRAALWPQTMLARPEWVAEGSHDRDQVPVQTQDGKERVDLREVVMAALAQVPYHEWKSASHYVTDGLRDALGSQADNLIRVLSDIPVDAP